MLVDLDRKSSDGCSAPQAEITCPLVRCENLTQIPGTKMVDDVEDGLGFIEDLATRLENREYGERSLARAMALLHEGDLAVLCWHEEDVIVDAVANLRRQCEEATLCLQAWTRCHSSVDKLE